MIYLLLAQEFFKIGLFSFGGGYSTIPFLYYLSEIYGWYSIKELSQMTALASVTPGPVGINVATYAGIKSAGFIGAFVSTTSEMLPSLFLVIVVSKLLKNFRDNFYVKSILEILKPTSCALVAAVVITLSEIQLCDKKSLIILSILLILSIKSKKEPIFYILLAALLGIIFSYFPSLQA